jgi:hypothetical protein
MVGVGSAFGAFVLTAGFATRFGAFFFAMETVVQEEYSHNNELGNSQE